MRFHVLVVSVLLPFLGCSKNVDKLAELHPVKGTVTKNGQPVNKGLVSFIPTDNQEWIVNSEVDANGKFELQTISQNGNKKGAPAGTYRVTYMPPGNDQNVTPVTTSKTYSVEPKANDLTIELNEK